MPVTLVSMPWQSLEGPSLPLGILRAVATRAGLPKPEIYPAYLRWAEFLMARTGEEINPHDYRGIAEGGIFDGVGDWVFAGVLHRDPGFGVSGLTAHAAARGIDVTQALRMREHAADFIDLAVKEILETEPTIVGFSTTFMQNVPSLAAAQRLKELAPEVTVVFGGGNCDGPMGAALHRNFRFVDFVVSGEAEDAFPALLRALGGDGDLAAVPGLVWRDSGDVQRRNQQGTAISPGRLAIPDFADYYERLAVSPAAAYVEPCLFLETARGCWWGEKHHCTFCGLNGTAMAFRALPADAVLDQVTTLVKRHQVLDIWMVDNIIDNAFFTSVLPRLAELDWDLRIHYEVKANLKPADLAALHAGHVRQIQPGIESLVSSVLGLMDKGVSGTHNVRTLRDGEATGLTVIWNWLYGFPGETPSAYEPVLSQLPALVHLQPPIGVARICLERFSPHFDNPALGFPERHPAAHYQYLYALSEEELTDLVYMFDTPHAGLSVEQAAPLRDRCDSWLADYNDSWLHRHDDGDAIVIEDRRKGWPERDHRIEGVWRAAYLELENGHTVQGLHRRLAAQAHDVAPASLTAWVAELKRNGLVFEESNRFVTLAVPSDPVKMEKA